MEIEWSANDWLDVYEKLDSWLNDGYSSEMHQQMHGTQRRM